MIAKITKFSLAVMLMLCFANAKEPTNWFFGVGFGAGYRQIDTKYPEAASNQMGISWMNWSGDYSSQAKDFGFNWEIVAGYKHFINNWIGFRYYVSVGSQHYKDEIFTAGKVKAGVFEYIGNADLLINFYTAELWSIDVRHSHVARNPIYNYSASQQPGNQFFYHNPRWAAQSNASLSSWSGAWEFLAGYKHFVNDWLGVRAYANIGVQHYKPSLFESKTDPIGIIDYTANVDLMLDFYETESWAIGMLAGLGFGGTSFDKKAIEKYMAVYDRATGAHIGKANIQAHFLNTNASVGLRGVYFQKSAKHPKEFAMIL